MQGNKAQIAKRCVACGKPGVVKFNDMFWLCADCAFRFTIFSLNCGVPVVEAVRGVPKALIVPRLLSKN